MGKNVAVILAGGFGSRLGMDIPKQFYKVAGKTIIEHATDVFQNHPLIDEIAIVIHPDYVSQIEVMVIANSWAKVKKILKGGKERADSSLAAINAYDCDGTVNLIFHDAVRPLINNRIITDVVKALSEYDAVDVAIPAVDTIISIDNSTNTISYIPDRSKLQRGQTPQAFKINIIKKAYNLALKDPAFRTTDDCGVVSKYMPDTKIYIVPGEESNMKLTYVEDMYILDKMFQLRSQLNTAVLIKDELKDKVIILFGGNSGIGKSTYEIAEQYGAHCYSFSRSTTGTDISCIDDVKNALTLVYQKEGKIDFVINTAAVLLKEPLHLMKYESIKCIIDVNYFGMVNVSLACFEYLKESRGRLLHFTSSSYTRGRAFYSLYSSTKAAVVNFVQAISQEWEPFGIKVNCINPERTKTLMRIKNFGVEPEETLLKSEIVAIAALETCLNDITGQVIDVKIR